MSPKRNIDSLENYPLIAIGTGKEFRFIYPGQIICCISEGTNSKLKLEDGQILHTSKKLNEIESILPSDLFIRIHQGHIINLMHASMLTQNGEDKVVMKDGTSHPVSSTKKSLLLQNFTICDNLGSSNSDVSQGV
ncbi:MAG: LytTR family transcriptional regulator [Saprospiraceae bacterium]|nr:LytTR family transcriptional regulator [Saprospiraceae bacterium]